MGGLRELENTEAGNIFTLSIILVPLKKYVLNNVMLYNNFPGLPLSGHLEKYPEKSCQFCECLSAFKEGSNMNA